MHPLFIRAMDCLHGTMKKSVQLGANQPQRKVGIFNIEDERRIMDHPIHSLLTLKGLSKRFVFWCYSVLLIRGQGELKKMEVGQFHEVLYDGKPIVRYDLLSF